MILNKTGKCNNTLIVIVLYNKQPSSLNVLRSIQASNDNKVNVFLYDNSSTSQCYKDFSEFVYYHHDSSNSGVSKAYNEAFSYAELNQYDYVLLLDQDTEFQLLALQKYIELSAKYQQNYIYAPIVSDGVKIYSPFYEANYVGKVQSKNNFEFNEIYNLSGKSVINSGLMVPVSIYKEIKGFDENIKLDFSDIYFIEKYKEKNENIILVDVELIHSLSGDEGKDFDKEIHRYKYYCNGAKLFSTSTGKSTLWSCTRRMLRLILKYKTFKPLYTFYHYYIGSKII